MKPRSIAISPLALALAISAPGAARAAECPDARPVTGTFRAVQVTQGTVITYPPQIQKTKKKAAVINATSIMRGVTFSGAMTGLDPAAVDREMGVTLQLDLVRLLATGQGYGTGEITITARPPVPFMSASTAFHGRLDAAITESNRLTGYFAAVGAGEFAGATLRGRFTAHLATVSGTPGPGPTPNPFGGEPTNPLGTGAGSGTANPLPQFPGGGGAPTNPFAPGSGGGTPTNPFTGTSPGGGSTPGSATTTAIEVSGTFGGPVDPAVIVEHDPMALVPILDAPDLAPALSGLFPLVQRTSTSLTTTCKGGEVTVCPGGVAATRRGIVGTSTVTLKAGGASAHYRAELSIDTCTSAGDTGYAQGRLRLFGRGTTPVYEGTVDGVLTPHVIRGRLVKGKFLWSGFLAMNAWSADRSVLDSLRSVFTAVGTFGRGTPTPFRLEAALGDAGDPFVRVMSAVPAR